MRAFDPANPADVLDAAAIGTTSAGVRRLPLWGEDCEQCARIAVAALESTTFAYAVATARGAAIDEARRLNGRSRGGSTVRHRLTAGAVSADVDPEVAGYLLQLPSAHGLPEREVLGTDGSANLLAERLTDRWPGWPERWRTLVVLLAEGRSKYEAAAVLGVSPGRVSQLVRDIRADLDPEHWSSSAESKRSGRRGAGLAVKHNR